MKTLLLLHGWNWKNYPQFAVQNAHNPWHNRQVFVNDLGKYMHVIRPSLPGFMGGPEITKPWTLDDYADWLEEEISKHELVTPDIILGYSFGAAILAHWKNRYQKYSVKTIFVSPAFIRKYTHRHKLGKPKNLARPFLAKPFFRFFSDIYLTKIIRNPFYIHATKHMRNTYRNIVSLDLSNEIRTLIKYDNGYLTHPYHPANLFIFGEDDKSTPSDLFLHKVPEAKPFTKIISNGGHDIANSHTKELIDIILEEAK